jgi:hypothetical protein
MENNNKVSEQAEEKQETSVGYWSTPEQVAEAAAEVSAETPVVEAPKAEEVPAEPVVEETPVEAPAPAEESKPEVQHLGSVKNGVMGTTSVPKPEPRSFEKAKPEDSEEKVAIHSSKNVAWQGVGKVSRGYNIVTKEIADQWLTRSHVRLATPEEVKKAFG